MDRLESRIETHLFNNMHRPCCGRRTAHQHAALRLLRGGAAPMALAGCWRGSAKCRKRASGMMCLRTGDTRVHEW